ncbi:TPR domain-containing protein [Fusarium denticulatum]|uniref:TPR domain-containing protein n=1 Tax=Fusarium denticulatum TaxID=48507 RepID=A0A8H6CWB2_9HYPO|nr:TPR domain-containing protein [Fusarium denticulatum]
MASTVEKKRFSLLVGVGAYPSNNSRKFENGNPISLRNLPGAVNDVKNMSQLLVSQFNFEKPTILLSSPSRPTSPTTQESEHSLPTHANIKKQLGEICKDTKEGDLFLFYFAGHGATLKTLETSPKDGRENDPSLLTGNYCEGKPPVRGWELNLWLRKFGEKGVRVVVIIDSCYSEKAWRDNDKQRTPFDWSEPPNLPSDEIVMQGTKGKPGHRDGELETFWDLNLPNMTVMTACKGTETASEQEENGLLYGAFTLALRKCLQTLEPASTYRILKDGTTKFFSAWSVQQNPQVFGQDRLVFLQDFEPVTTTPFLGMLKDGQVSLDAGKIHGINPRTEFVSTSAVAVKVMITDTGDYTSTATISEGSIPNSSQVVQLVPSRWSTAKSLKVTIDPNLGSDFKKYLDPELDSRLVGEFSCSRESAIPDDKDEKIIHLHLEKSKDHDINILAQEWVTKNEGPVRGWKLEGQTEKDKAKESAIAIRHLFRLGQIRQLESNTRGESKLEYSISTDEKDPLRFKYDFKNSGMKELHFVVLILSAGFHVKQLYPVEDKTCSVKRNDEDYFKFRLKAPDKSKIKEPVEEQQEYCDTIRTIVMRGKGVSMKNIELPDIWNAGEWEEKTNKEGRDGDVEEEFDWWIDDKFLTYMA